MSVRNSLARFAVLAAFLPVAAALAVGCHNNKSSADNNQRKAQVTPAPANDLYHRIGESKLRSVVNDLVDASAKDPKVALDKAGQARHWNETPENVRKFKDGLFQFLAASTGGPQIYHGPDMVTAHKGMDITGEQFDAMLTHLKQAMDKNHVPADQQKELTQVFNGTRGAIVQQQG